MQVKLLSFRAPKHFITHISTNASQFKHLAKEKRRRDATVVTSRQNVIMLEEPED